MQQSLRTHTAQKQHTCDRCNGTIRSGQKYMRITEFEAGAVEVTKMHHPSEECGGGRRRSRQRSGLASLDRGWAS